MSADPFKWPPFWPETMRPPMNVAEVEQKLTELAGIEWWLQAQLQAIQTQKNLLQQQKTFFETFTGSPKDPL